MEGQGWAWVPQFEVPGIPLLARKMSNLGVSLLASFRQSRIKDMWLDGVFWCHIRKQV